MVISQVIASSFRCLLQDEFQARSRNEFLHDHNRLEVDGPGTVLVSGDGKWRLLIQNDQDF
jgi:hypothetical protein